MILGMSLSILVVGNSLLGLGSFLFLYINPTVLAISAAVSWMIIPFFLKMRTGILVIAVLWTAIGAAIINYILTRALVV